MKKKNVWKQATAMTLALGIGLSSSMMSFAEEGRSDCWVKDEWGNWKVKKEDGNYLTDGWFQDIDGSWYFFNYGMPVTSLACIGDYTYYFDSGKMITEDGYEGLNITFNHEHNGHYGSIISGSENFFGAIGIFPATYLTYSLLDSSLNTLDTASTETTNSNTNTDNTENSSNNTSNSSSKSLVDEWNEGIDWDLTNDGSADGANDFGKWK